MIEYWPFLIAANESWDYRIVLCPDFIEQAGRRSVLRNSLDPSTALAEGTGSCDVSDDRLGTVSLRFKANRLKDGIRDAYDTSGRPLVAIGGIALRSGMRLGRPDPTVLQHALEQALPEIENVLAQVRSAETSPKLRLSEKQSYCEEGDHSDAAKAALPTFATEDNPKALPGTANVLAQVRSADTSPKLRLSERQTCSDDRTYSDAAKAALPAIPTEDNPNRLKSKDVARSASGRPKAMFAITAGVMIAFGWLYLGTGVRNNTETPGHPKVSRPVQKSLNDIEADAGWQHDLALAFEKVGDILGKQGDLPDALLCYRDNLAIIERLVKSNPGNAEWQRDLAVSHGRVDRVEALQSGHSGTAGEFR